MQTCQMVFVLLSDKRHRTQPQQRSEAVKGDELKERAVLSVRASRSGGGGQWRKHKQQTNTIEKNRIGNSSSSTRSMKKKRTRARSRVKESARRGEPPQPPSTGKGMHTRNVQPALTAGRHYSGRGFKENWTSHHEAIQQPPSRQSNSRTQPYTYPHAVIRREKRRSGGCKRNMTRWCTTQEEGLAQRMAPSYPPPVKLRTGKHGGHAAMG